MGEAATMARGSAAAAGAGAGAGPVPVAAGGVAERALFLWNNDHIVSLIAQNRSVIFPIIFEALERNIQSHWNQAVHGLTANVSEMFLDMDSELFEECQQQYIEKQARAKEMEEQRESAWRQLEAAVAAKALGDDMVLVN
ncbi:hypothetical protein E2562_028120 [Oryza meyeriana var. granulata]|uniref:Uncharacterized protein n=1 Tax=Oryza meyeriana var. granulata TaxID=110450 RepID=A0A6G1CB19_9ORYZ|nr:hypothetical protein E2562_028120 [Oryza meyeriana var. granulata]